MHTPIFSLQRGYLFLGTVISMVLVEFLPQFFPMPYIYLSVVFFITLLIICIHKKQKICFSLLCGGFLGCSSVYLQETLTQQTTILPSGTLYGQVVAQLAKDRRQVVASGSRYMITTDQEMKLGDMIGFVPSLPRYLKYPSPQAENYQQWLHLKGYQGSYTPYILTIIGHAPLPLHRNIRKQIGDHFHTLSLHTATEALLRGMIFGDTAGLTPQQLDTFVASGLIHIVAVSGSNMAFVILIGYVLFWRLPLYPRYVCVALLLLFYATICGWESSVVRATCFGVITLCSFFISRPRFFRSMFFCVATGMLLYSPQLLFVDRGWWLSFSATGTIMLFQSLFQDIYKKTTFFFKLSTVYILPTITATLGTLPFLLIFNHTYTLGSMFANLLAVLLLPLLTRSTLLALFLGLCGVSFSRLTNFLDRGCTFIYWLSETTVIHSPVFVTTGVTTYLISGGILCIVWGCGYLLWKMRT